MTDLAKVALPLLLVLTLAAAWQLTPLEQLGPEVREAVSSVREMPAAPLIVIAAFVVGGLLVAPVSVLMLATVVTFGPIRGGILALAGALASASVVFWIGRAVGRSSLERLLGDRFERVEEVLSHHGIMTVAIARNVPVAPYSVVNLAAGATPVGFWDYFFGTLIGFLPAIVALALLGDRIAEYARDPSGSSLLTLVGLVAALAAAGALAGRWLVRRVGR
jgi:uncharacterized membrane protein YdjX (TVP38/TMEM64 family)